MSQAIDLDNTLKKFSDEARGECLRTNDSDRHIAVSEQIMDAVHHDLAKHGAHKKVWGYSFLLCFCGIPLILDSKFSNSQWEMRHGRP